MSLFLFATAAAAGLLLGWAFCRLWSLTLPRRFVGGLSRGVALSVHAMLAAEDTAQYLTAYRAALGAAARRLARGLLALAVALLPAAVYALGIAPVLAGWRDRAAGTLTVHMAGEGSAARRTVLIGPGGGPLRVAAGNLTLTLDDPHGRYAWCRSGLACAGLALLGLTPRRLPAAAAGRPALVVARPSHDAVNPFWPYLDDPDALFMLAMAGAMTGFGLGRRRVPRPARA